MVKRAHFIGFKLDMVWDFSIVIRYFLCLNVFLLILYY